MSISLINLETRIDNLETPSILTASGSTSVPLVNNQPTVLTWEFVTTTGAASASDLPTETSDWTCSDPGIYFIILNYYLLNSVQDTAQTANAYIQKSTDGGSNWTLICAGRFQVGQNSDNDTGNGANNTIARYISMNIGDKIRVTVTGFATSGFMSVVFSEERTFLQIVKQR